jgi:archaeosine-15-forming tRNA-guanine transglycosylase
MNRLIVMHAHGAWRIVVADEAGQPWARASDDKFASAADAQDALDRGDFAMYPEVRVVMAEEKREVAV